MLLSVFLCIFFSKSLLFLCLTVQYLILGRLETATISQLSFNMQVSIIFPRHVSTLPVNLFLRLLNPGLPLCPVLEPAQYRRQPAEGAAGSLFKENCWQAVSRTLENKQGHYFSSVGAIRMRRPS